MPRAERLYRKSSTQKEEDTGITGAIAQLLSGLLQEAVEVARIRIQLGREVVALEEKLVLKKLLLLSGPACFRCPPILRNAPKLVVVVRAGKQRTSPNV